jgi:hypothetical protein
VYVTPKRYTLPKLSNEHDQGAAMVMKHCHCVEARCSIAHRASVMNKVSHPEIYRDDDHLAAEANEDFKKHL